MIKDALRWPGVAQAAAVAFLIGHLVLVVPFSALGPDGSGAVSFLSFDLDDIDAVNLAMGVQHFDVAQHRPHPPGYPIYVLLGKLGKATIGSRYMGHYSNGYYATAMAFWSALAGALAAFPLYRLFRLIVDDGRVAAGAMLVTLTCPLFWYTASRPLSDVPGLAAALAVQAIIATAFVGQQGWRDRSVTSEELMATGRLIVLGAFLAGLIIGLRSQSFWLTLPLLVVVIADRAGRGAAGAIVGAMLTFPLGVLLWLVPTAIVSGPMRYWTALWSQAGEDIEGVDMLLTSTQPVRRLALNLYQTFVLPWGPLPLAVVVLTLALLGIIVMLRRSRRGLVLLAGLAVPYAIFHLVYQENVTTRYALPLVPAIALLCVCGAQAILRRGVGVAAVAIAVAGVWSTVPALARAASPHVPVFALFGSFNASRGLMRDRTERWHPRPDDPVVAMHRRMFTETRRAREWMGPTLFPWKLLPSPRGHEWLELGKYWREGGSNKIYFVADPRRTDLALIDPASRHFNGHYGWPLAYATTFVGGARPNELDWYVIDGTPGWFLGEGWAVTPETAGVANLERKGPTQGGATGWIRRRPGPLRLLLGGRNLGAAGAAAVRFTATIDGRALESWDVAPAPGFFLRALELPAGALLSSPPASEPGAGRFAELRVTATAADGSPSPVPAAIEQFDAQSPDAVMFGYGDGWHEAEYNPATGLSWRWSSDASTISVWNGGRDARVRISAESPLQTFDEAPIVTLKAGDRELARMTPRDAFTVDVRVPAATLAASGGRVTLTTTRVFVPAEAVGPSDPRRNDRRRLGLRVLSVTVTPAS